MSTFEWALQLEKECNLLMSDCVSVLVPDTSSILVVMLNLSSCDFVGVAGWQG